MVRNIADTLRDSKIRNLHLLERRRASRPFHMGVICGLRLSLPLNISSSEMFMSLRYYKFQIAFFEV